MKNKIIVLLLACITFLTLQSNSSFADSGFLERKPKYKGSDLSVKSLKSLILKLGVVEVNGGEANNESLSKRIAVGILNEADFTNFCEHIGRSGRSSCTLTISFKPGIGELPAHTVKVGYTVLTENGYLYPEVIHVLN